MLFLNKIILLGFMAGLAFIGASAGPHNTFAAVSTWEQSASINPRYDTDFASDAFKQSLRNLASTGANFVTLIIPWYQSSIHSTDIGRGWNTPTDESLINAIQFAHSLGLKVSLKPHLESYDGAWRAHINPGDRASWFAAYGTRILNHYAVLGADNGVEEIVVGTELISMSSAKINGTNTQNWINLINDMRVRFPGRLIYSANWGPSGFADEKNQIEFWHALDAVGISAYFELTSDWNNSVEFLKSAWDSWNNTHIRPLVERTGKPIIFTEVGYRSVGGAHTDPWNCCRGGYIDETEQANSYEALFSYWNSFPYMIGVSWWEWSSDPNAGGPGDMGYTPQNKKAQGVMANWFGSSSPPPTSPTPGGTPVFEASSSISPASPAVGQTTIINTSVKNTGSPASGIIVDIEVYNESGARVFQKVFGEQSFASGETKSYSGSWTPSSAGTYKIKNGIFSQGWITLYKWVDDAGTISVGNSDTPPPNTPPSTGGAIDIWWPTDGSTVMGTQPFKAILSGKSISEYEMFWQVDGDIINMMFDNLADYPHKEVSVDLSGWTWKGTASYLINFVAKTFGGSVLGERAINIFVSN